MLFEYFDIFSDEDVSGSAQELAWNGMDYYEQGEYEKAIEYFERIKDWHPFSKFAMLAELKLADSYYHLEQYEEAIYEYEEFENLHPSNDAIPYVIFQIGLCHYEQMDTIDRDQKQTREALDAFYRLVDQFPSNHYAKRAEEYITVCLKQLAEHEFYVAMFYFRSRHYKAALYRFKAVLTKYPDAGVHQSTLDYITICEQKVTEEELVKAASSGKPKSKSWIPFMD
jgi:outer membrane protein assembly factor BamD